MVYGALGRRCPACSMRPAVFLLVVLNHQNRCPRDFRSYAAGVVSPSASSGRGRSCLSDARARARSRPSPMSPAARVPVRPLRGPLLSIGTAAATITRPRPMMCCSISVELIIERADDPVGILRLGPFRRGRIAGNPQLYGLVINGEGATPNVSCFMAYVFPRPHLAQIDHAFGLEVAIQGGHDRFV